MISSTAAASVQGFFNSPALLPRDLCQNLQGQVERLAHRLLHVSEKLIVQRGVSSCFHHSAALRLAVDRHGVIAFSVSFASSLSY